MTRGRTKNQTEGTTWRQTWSINWMREPFWAIQLKMESTANSSLEGDRMAGPEYCTLRLKFAQLGIFAAVGWSA